MFTGLIEEIGIIERIEQISDGRRLKISAAEILNDVKVNDSIAVNGVCLTAIKVEKRSFWAEAVGETLKKTTLDTLQQNTKVNLERALRLLDRIGGHLVQGHVNGIGIIKKINRLGENYYFEIETPKEFVKYLVLEASIAIDGISLTIAYLKGNLIGLSIIPHTLKKTNLQYKQISDEVNIEIDILAKYVEKLHDVKNEYKSLLTDERLKKMGF
jgi:riboflavin synthase